jgi:hypothetical protein
MPGTPCGLAKPNKKTARLTPTSVFLHMAQPKITALFRQDLWLILSRMQIILEAYL